jgi:hypothetical protein
MKIKLQDWIHAHIQAVGDEMLWKGAFGDQIYFVRDRLAPVVGVGLEREYDERCGDIVYVISTHQSKSITLPVYEIVREDLGLKIVLRDNFYNWKMSVISDKPVEADFTGLFITSPPTESKYTGDHLHPVYFEGFPGDLIFGYYDTSDKKKWSAEIGDSYDLMTVVFLIMRSLGAIKPAVYYTEASHTEMLKKDKEKFDRWMAKQRG